MRQNSLVRIAVAMLLGAVALGAQAAPRTFVASTGLDTNLCSLAQPCRSFSRALTQTDADGEIIVLDSAGYGVLTITQSVSIIAPDGIYAGVTVPPGQTGATVNPGAAGKVVLRGLSLNGQPGMPVATGIRVISGSEVHIERCVVSNMTAFGIMIDGGTAVYVSDSVVRSGGSNGISIQGGTPEVFVTDTRVADNGGNGIAHQAGTLTLDRVRSQRNAIIGLAVSPQPGPIRALVRDSQFSGNSNGVVVSSEAGEVANVTIERSAAFNNDIFGFSASSLGGTVNLFVSDSVANDNVITGIAVSGPAARVFVSACTVAGNATGFSQSGTASFFSLGNNVRRGNTADFSGVITTIGLQ